MKTTLNIDDTVMARLRREAARSGRTMSELVEAGLRLLLQSPPSTRPAKLPPLPRFNLGPAKVDVADRDALYRAMEERWVLVVDTNVLIYAADRRSEHHATCMALLEKLRTQALPWYLTWGIVYEFLRVATHPNVFPRPLTAKQAMEFVNALTSSPSASMLLPTERHAGILRETLRELPHLRGNIIHDAHTAVLMREHGIGQICTRDADFHRFPFVSVIDPLKM